MAENMELIKGQGKKVTMSLSEAHTARLQAMVERLPLLPGTEASLSDTEVFFYELLTIMKAYTEPDGTNPYLKDLEEIRQKEYAKCRDRFVSISSRNNSVRLFKNKLQHTIAAWLQR